MPSVHQQSHLVQAFGKLPPEQLQQIQCNPGIVGEVVAAAQAPAPESGYGVSITTAAPQQAPQRQQLVQQHVPQQASPPQPQPQPQPQQPPQRHQPPQQQAPQRQGQQFFEARQTRVKKTPTFALRLTRKSDKPEYETKSLTLAQALVEWQYNVTWKPEHSLNPLGGLAMIGGVDVVQKTSGIRKGGKGESGKEKEEALDSAVTKWRKNYQVRLANLANLTRQDQVKVLRQALAAAKEIANTFQVDSWEIDPWINLV